MTKKIVHVKHKTFETGKTNIAVPVTGTTQSEIINQATRHLNTSLMFWNGELTIINRYLTIVTTSKSLSNSDHS